MDIGERRHDFYENWIPRTDSTGIWKQGGDIKDIIESRSSRRRWINFFGILGEFVFKTSEMNDKSIFRLARFRTHSWLCTFRPTHCLPTS